MEINGSITILTGESGVSIEIHDNDASLTFLRVFMTPDQFCHALSRLAHKECKVEVFALERVGLKMEHRTNLIILGKDFDALPYGKERKEYLKRESKRQCPEGWSNDGYFQSQDSIYQEKGVTFARDTIRRWVKKGGELDA